MKKPALIVASSCLALIPVLSFAQAISYVTPGAQVTEDFNNNEGWSANSATVSWEDGQTFSGWYGLYFNGNDGGSYTVPPSFGVTAGGQFSSSVNNLYVFRDTDVAQDGALGTQQTDGVMGAPSNSGGVYFGVRIQNDTGIALTRFTIGYTGEQWRATSSANANSFAVSYSADASESDGVWLNTGSWTDIPELLFTAPHIEAGSNTSLDGNADENRTVFAPQTISLASELAPGESLYIRWFSPNVGGIDHSIGVDDFVFTAIPEPRTYALLFGAAVLGVAGVCRIRRGNCGK